MRKEINQVSKLACDVVWNDASQAKFAHKALYWLRRASYCKRNSTKRLSFVAMAESYLYRVEKTIYNPQSMIEH